MYPHNSSMEMGKKIKTLVPVEGIEQSVAQKLVFSRGGKSNLCIRCRGARLLCGKASCPLLVRIRSFIGIADVAEREELEGSSPPEVFVSWRGYPRVRVGPLVPPIVGDTSLYGKPNEWMGRGLVEVVKMRSKLVHSSFYMDVRGVRRGGKLYDGTLEIALSSRPADVDAVFLRKPKLRILVDPGTQPMGPSGLVRRLDVTSVRGDRRLEKVYYDFDMKANSAILQLFRDGVDVYRITRLLSVGGVGFYRNRRLVPTRWSITAVDDTISRHLLHKHVKYLPPINEYRVYEHTAFGNRFIVVLMPRTWIYESIETWFPSTPWNPDTRNIAMIGDWEDHRGRSAYASMGGCYYAARLSVAEHLYKEGRQAGVLILREIYSDYLMPLGVWLVRESVKRALNSRPAIFNSREEALRYAFSRLLIPEEVWRRNSFILRNLQRQRSLLDFV